MYRHRLLISTALLFVFLIGTSKVARAGNVVKMCGDISETNELQISVECLESLVGLLHDNYREPMDFMAELQRVGKLIKAGKPLSADENILWVMVRDKMRTMVLRGLSRSEFLAKDGNSAVCAEVLALGHRYGFCTYLRSLELSEENYATARILRPLVRTNNNTASTSSSFGNESVTLVVHLNLFNDGCNFLSAVDHIEAI